MLALVDTSAVVDEIEQRWRRGGGVFLAVALAKRGRADALVAELERLSSDPELAEEWLYTDETIALEQALARVAPLPEEVRAAVDRKWPGWFARHSSRMSCSRRPRRKQRNSPGQTSAPATFRRRSESSSARRSARALPEHDVYQAEPVVKLADALYRLLDGAARAQPLRLAARVGAPLPRPTRDERQSGDDAVLYASALGAGYRPDVEGLLDAWRRCSKDDDLARSQIAWVACRAPLSQLLERLAPEIADDPQPLPPSSRQPRVGPRTGEPPLTPAGDKPKAPELAPPGELLEDMLGAAPPPEMAAPGPPMAEASVGDAAEPELAEANGAPRPTAGRTRGADLGGAEPEASAAAEPRWILVWVTDAAAPEQPMTIAFRAGAVHEIAVAIGPNQEGAIAAVGGRPFDEELGAVADMEELTVTFLAPSVSMQQTGSIFLPRTGTSRRVTFAVKLPADIERFDAEIRVHHKNRIVQMARLSGLVAADPAQALPGSRIELEVAAIVPDNVDLGSRAGADAGIVRTDAGTTAVAGEDFLGFDDDRLGRVVREGRLLEVLTGLATSDASRQRKLEDAVDDLRALAFQGCELYPVIGRPLVESLAGRPLDRLEVLVDERSGFFPLELVYDLPAPAKDAKPLPGLEDSAEEGRVHEAARGGGRRAPSSHLLPERLLGALEGDRATSRGKGQLAPGRRSRRLRDRRSPGSDDRARHARVASRGPLRRQRQGRRGEEGRHRQRPEGPRPDRRADHVRGDVGGMG